MRRSPGHVAVRSWAALPKYGAAVDRWAPSALALRNKRLWTVVGSDFDWMVVLTIMPLASQAWALVEKAAGRFDRARILFERGLKVRIWAGVGYLGA